MSHYSFPNSLEQEIPADLYKQFNRMIRSFVWKYSRGLGARHEDLLGEAHLIFCQSVRSFDPSRGVSFSTYLYSQLEGITHYIAREARYSRNIITELPDGEGKYLDALEFCGSEDAGMLDREWSEYYQIMTEDAKALVDFQRFGELDPPPSAKQKRKPLTAWSVFQRRTKVEGWTWGRTQEAWADLRAVLEDFRTSGDLSWEG